MILSLSVLWVTVLTWFWNFAGKSCVRFLPSWKEVRVMFVRFGVFGNIVLEISWFFWSLGYSLHIVVLISWLCPLYSLC